MAALSDVLNKSGLTIDQGGTASVSGAPAPRTLSQVMGAPPTSQNPSGGVALSPQVASAVGSAGGFVGLQGTVQVPPPSPAAPVQGPVAPPPPPAFAADVPSSMDATTVAGAMSNPVTLPIIPDQNVYQMNDGRYYNPSTGISGTKEEAMGTSPAPSATSPAPTSTETSASAVNDDVTQAIKSLFPQSETLVQQYQDLRKSSGLVEEEAALAAANKEAADMQAVINGIEDEVRVQAGGQADASFIEATVADRIRRLMPQINRINARVTALTSSVQSKKDDITAQLGLSQQDIQNARQQQVDLRQGINDMLSTFGSAAFAGADPAVLAELEKRAGLPPGSISAKAKTLEEQTQNKLQFQEVNGKIFTFNQATGEVKDTGIFVPADKTASISSLLSIAGQFGNTPADVAAAYQFLSSSLGGGGTTAGSSGVDSTAIVGKLPDDQLASVLASMAKREGFGADATNRPTRDNNPLNIKVPSGGIEEARKRYGDPGATVDPVPATDGGQFIRFSSPEKGFEAAATLIRSDVYSGLTLDAALKKWSGGGYGAEILGGAQTPLAGSDIGRKGSTPALNPQTPADLATVANRLVASPRMANDDRVAFVNNFNSLIASGDTAGALAAVKDAALKTVGISEQNKYADYQTNQTRLNGLKGALSSFEAVNPNLYKSILEKGKTLAAASKDQKWLDLVSQVEAAQVELRRGFFGTAITDRETATGENLFIDTKKDTLQDMETKLNTLAALANTSAQGILNYALGI